MSAQDRETATPALPSQSARVVRRRLDGRWSRCAELVWVVCGQCHLFARALPKDRSVSSQDQAAPQPVPHRQPVRKPVRSRPAQPAPLDPRDRPDARHHSGERARIRGRSAREGPQAPTSVERSASLFRCGRKVRQMQIDLAALTASIGELYDLDLERGVAPTLQQVVMAPRPYSTWMGRASCSPTPTVPCAGRARLSSSPSSSRRTRSGWRRAVHSRVRATGNDVGAEREHRA